MFCAQPLNKSLCSSPRCQPLFPTLNTKGRAILFQSLSDRAAPLLRAFLPQPVAEKTPVAGAGPLWPQSQI